MKVESVLDEPFFRRIGRYVATCAHIEKMAWLIVAHTEVFNLDDDESVKALLSRRKQTSDLFKALKGAAAKHEPELGNRITEVHNRIDEGLTYRHMAVHGAWRLGDDGAYKVEYYKNHGTSKAPDWKAFVASVSVDDLDDALAEADGILSELMSIYKDTGFP